jgi:hypothetical protein
MVEIVSVSGVLSYQPEGNGENSRFHFAWCNNFSEESERTFCRLSTVRTSEKYSMFKNFETVLIIEFHCKYSRAVRLYHLTIFVWKDGW